MDDLEQEFGRISVMLYNTDRSAPSPAPQNLFEPDNNKNNETSLKTAPDKNISLSQQPSTPTVDNRVPAATMTDFSSPDPPRYIKRFGHRNEIAVTPVTQTPTVEDAREDLAPDSPASSSSVEIVTEATTRPSDARPSAYSQNDRLIDTASDSSDPESDHHDTFDEAVVGRGQSSSNTDSLDSDTQKKHDNNDGPAPEQTPEVPSAIDDATIERPTISPPRSKAFDEVEDDEDEAEDDEDEAEDDEDEDEAEDDEDEAENDKDDQDYNPANNKFYTPSSGQRNPSSEDDGHDDTTAPTVEPPTKLDTYDTKTTTHKPPSGTSIKRPRPRPQPQPLPEKANLAASLRRFRQHDTERENEFIALYQENFKLHGDKKRLMTENRDLRLKNANLRSIIDLRLENANLRSIIDGNIDLEQAIDATSENPSPGTVSRLSSSTDHHPNDSYGGDASSEHNSNISRPSFDSRSYVSNANMPHVRAKWQSKEEKKTLMNGTRLHDWQEVSRKKNGRANLWQNPRLNGPILGTSNNTSPMRHTKDLLHNAEGLRLDAPLRKPPALSMVRISRMNDEQHFCHSDVRGRCLDAHCQYRHTSGLKLSNDEELALRHLFQRLPCKARKNCSDAGCIFGHVCHLGADCPKGSKCLLAATHGLDRRPVRDAEAAEELISTAEN